MSGTSENGPEEDRTPDPLLAKQVLSQLSYRPPKKMVGPSEFESLTPALSARCSNQLSYGPEKVSGSDK